MSMNVCVYEDLHGKKWLYTYGAILNKYVLLLLLLLLGKAKNTLRFVKRNIKTSNKKVKEMALILMSALSSNTVPPSGVPGKKLFHKKINK